MWVAELRVWHKGSPMVEASRSLEGEASVLYLNTFEEGGKTYVNRVLTASGSNAKKWFDAVASEEKDRTVIEGIEGNQLFYSIAGTNQFHSLVSGRSILFIKPIVVRAGFEYWTIAAMRKIHITRLVKRLTGMSIVKVRLLSLRKKPLDFFLPSSLERLSKRQRWAFNAACAEGYYSFPRKRSLKQISSQLGIPEATFRQHLRKAEAKILPALYAMTENRG